MRASPCRVTGACTAGICSGFADNTIQGGLGLSARAGTWVVAGGRVWRSGAFCIVKLDAQRPPPAPANVLTACRVFLLRVGPHLA